MKFTTPLLRFIYLCAIPAVLSLSCGKKNEFAPPPPMPVGVQSPIIRDQPTFFEFPGHLEARRTVVLAARVKGILKTISPDFVAGRKVKAGTVLFKIDDTQYRAAFEAAKAQLIKAKADLNIAEITLKRRETAAEAISKIQIDTAKANVKVAKALVKQAEANLTEAQNTLSWCQIKAPFTGRISELKVDQFNLVGNDGATELCTMVDDSTLRVYFDVSERAILQHLKKRKSEHEQKSNPTLATLTLADGTVYPEPATIDYADVQVNKQTGTVRVRAIVPNKDESLIAGLYVTVKLTSPDPGKNSILIPSIAVQRDLGGDFVLVVTPDNTVQRVNITLGQRIDRLRIVKEGLTGKEKIIVQGFQRVREGAKVTPKPVPYEKDNTPKQPIEDPKNINSSSKVPSQ